MRRKKPEIKEEPLPPVAAIDDDGNCIDCGTNADAFGAWQEAEAQYQAALDPTQNDGRPGVGVRDARRETRNAWDRRAACPRKHGEG